MPFEVREEAARRRHTPAYNGYAHAFAGMSVQFALFAAIELAVGILLERQRGLWKRLRSAPLSRTTLLLAKAISGTILTLMTLLASFALRARRVRRADRERARLLRGGDRERDHGVHVRPAARRHRPHARSHAARGDLRRCW